MNYTTHQIDHVFDDVDSFTFHPLTFCVEDSPSDMFSSAIALSRSFSFSSSSYQSSRSRKQKSTSSIHSTSSRNYRIILFTQKLRRFNSKIAPLSLANEYIPYAHLASNTITLFFHSIAICLRSSTNQKLFNPSMVRECHTISNLILFEQA